MEPKQEVTTMAGPFKSLMQRVNLPSGRRGVGLLCAVLLAGCGATLTSAPSGAQSTAADPATPMMAGRVSALDGDVRIWRVEEDGGGQWDSAQINDVVTSGTGLSVNDGRVEMRVGPHAFRLGSGSTGGFDELDFDSKAFALERGVLNVRLASPQQNERVTLQVADVQVTFDAPGRYRVDALDGAPLQVVAFEGRAVVLHAGRSAAVQTGQSIAVTQSQISFGRANAVALDDWALARDVRIAQSVSAATRFVSPNMTGFEELDQHGNWVASADFGTVWMPRAVPVGWVPYRDGRWRWVAPWGWTWVDAAPWGFAPFHYGRWVLIGSQWAWWPGRVVAQPVWAPALVGWVGGTTVSVSVGGPGPMIGWFPLAPWQPWRPVHRVSHTHVTVINQTIIQRPPRGFAHDVNQRPGSTWVPDQRFRDPVVRVRIPEANAPVGRVREATPPPRPVIAHTSPRGDEWRARPPVSTPGGQRQPGQAALPDPRNASAPRAEPNRPPGTVPPAQSAIGRSSPKADIDPPRADVPRPGTRAEGPSAAPRPGSGQPLPNERTTWKSRALQPSAQASQNPQDARLAPAQPMPGSNGGLSQPAPIRGVEPRQAPRSQDEVRDRTQRNAAQPRPTPRVPQEMVPPYQQMQRPVAPAEPARTPPAAPPTIRQPAATPPQRAVPPAAAPAAPVQRSAPVAPVERAAPPPEAPRANAASPGAQQGPKQRAAAMER